MPSLTDLVRQLTIRTKEGLLVPLRPNWAQHQLLAEVERQEAAGRPVRIMVLKARQLGISTIIEAIMFVRAFQRWHSNGLVITHETDATEHVFNMTKLYWDYYPFRDLFSEKYNSRREMTWNETNSTIRVATAGKRGGVGRSRTLNYLHASEVAFWPDASTTMLGLRQTIPEQPNTMIALESTANGVGNWFHQQWVEASEGENEYTPLFFPWYHHPEYTASHAGLSVDLAMLDSEERHLRDVLGVDEDHLAWRRWAIRNLTDGKVEDFHQEYPSTPEEAFITSGTNAFNLERLRECYEPMTGTRGRIIPDAKTGAMKFQPDPTGPLTIFRLPSADRDWGQYFVSGDPAHAGGQDYACAQVINRRMYEQVAVWHARIDPITFADELVKIARFYNDAEVSTETEGPGYATVGRLISLEYPHVWRHRFADRVPGNPSQLYGWSTNWKRKDWAISELHKLILDGSLTLHDRGTYAELRGYVLQPGVGYGPADPAGHDDRVMALAIGVVCSTSEGPILPYENRELQDTIEPLPEWATWSDSFDEVS